MRDVAQSITRGSIVLYCAASVANPRVSISRAAASIVFAVSVVPGVAHAQAPSATLLAYRAPEECPQAADFQRSVQRRSSRIRFVDEGSHGRELSIAIVRERTFTIGELRLTETDGSVRQRSVRFSSCTEAVEGLALITLVSLDPQALLEPPPAAPETPPPLPVRPVRLAVTPPPPAPNATVEVGVGAEIAGTYDALPALAPMGRLFLDVGSRAHSAWAPYARLSLAHSRLSGVERSGAEASFAATIATLSACPLRAGSQRLFLRPCSFLSGGALHAGGEATTNAQSRARPYWAWGGSLLAFVGVSSAIEVVGDFGLGAPLIRDRYAFEQVLFWKTPALYLSAGIGARFVFR